VTPTLHLALLPAWNPPLDCLQLVLVALELMPLAPRTTAFLSALTQPAALARLAPTLTAPQHSPLALESLSTRKLSWNIIKLQI
jgi:hypothetical protein